MQLIGIDGAKQGYWVVASADATEPTSPVFELTDDLTDLFKRASRGECLVVIDVPIGILSGAAAAAGRVCDREARSVVGPRASSVFTPPSREAFGSATQPVASERNRRACGLGFGSHAFGILSRIESIDALMTPALQCSVREGHPEVTFAKLKGAFIEYPKKTREGSEERLRLLESENIEFNVDAERLRLGRSLVSRDDIIDVAAMLVSATRIANEGAEVLGDSQRDIRGLLMQMWA